MEFLKSFVYRFDFGRFMLPNIGINTLVDIILVAYLVYHIILWMKETRAFTLLKGIVVILFVFAISYVFNLYTIQWIIEGALNVSVIALIVIFQPELRRALEKIGQGRIGQAFGMGGKVGKKSISEFSKEEILEACLRLSSARTGALIVMEQKTPMGEYAGTGVLIDSRISKELMLNIFEDKAPLHDGAMIIKNNRIVAASCILPLTEKELSSELGTRHRAALGLSEVSDAYVVVVSEESGKISFAHDGELELDVTAERLETVLNRLYLQRSKDDPGKSFLSTFFETEDKEDTHERKD